MYCQKCGKNIPDDSAVCPFCGNSITGESQHTQSVYVEPDTTPLTVGNYLLMWLIMIIPIANIIMLCIWGFGSGTTNVNKKNFARAQLIIMVIATVITILMWTSLVGFLFASYSMMY